MQGERNRGYSGPKPCGLQHRVPGRSLTIQTRDRRDRRDKRDKRDLVGPKGSFLDTFGVPRATFWTYLVSRVVPGRALRTVGKKVIQKYGNLLKLEAQRSPNGGPWAAFGQSVSHLGVALGT